MISQTGGKVKCSEKLTLNFSGVILLELPDQRSLIRSLYLLAMTPPTPRGLSLQISNREEEEGCKEIRRGKKWKMERRCLKVREHTCWFLIGGPSQESIWSAVEHY